jgi:RHS repeat-associated protein
VHRQRGPGALHADDWITYEYGALHEGELTEVAALSGNHGDFLRTKVTGPRGNTTLKVKSTSGQTVATAYEEAEPYPTEYEPITKYAPIQKKTDGTYVAVFLAPVDDQTSYGVTFQCRSDYATQCTPLNPCSNSGPSPSEELSDSSVPGTCSATLSVNGAQETITISGGDVVSRSGSLAQVADQGYTLRVDNVTETDATLDVFGGFTYVTGEEVVAYGPGTYSKITSYTYTDRGQVERIEPPSFYAPPHGAGDDFVTTHVYDEIGQRIETYTPDSGTERTVYDRFGRERFAWHEDLGAQVKYWKYDEENRIVEEGLVDHVWDRVFLEERADEPEWPQSAHTWRTRHTYGGFGTPLYARNRLHIAAVNENEDAAAETVESYTYDRLGRRSAVTQQTLSYDAAERTTRYTYDGAGSITRIEYPAGGLVIDRTRDAAGRLIGVGTPGNPDRFVSYVFGDLGEVKERRLDDGQIVQTFSYTASGQLEHMSDSKYFEQALTYRNDGQISRVDVGYGDEATRTVASYHYDYDRYGQLIRTTADDAASDHNLQVAYDPNGNITQFTRKQSTTTYAYYAGTNRIMNVDGGGNDYTYDARGNVTAIAPRNVSSIVYDAFTAKPRCMTADGTTRCYEYGPSDERVYKSGSGGALPRLYVRGAGSSLLAEVTSAGPSLYVRGNGGLVARKDADGWVFYIRDYLGSTRVLVRDDGGVYEEADYDSFGRPMTQQGSLRYSYTGQETEEADLMNYGARFYDPVTGRFLAPDPAGQFHSPYTYVGNNPVSMVDPNGEFGILVGAILSAMAAYTTETVKTVVSQEPANFGTYAGATISGAFSGAMTGMSAASAVDWLSSTALSKATSYLPGVSLGNVGGVDLTLRPSFAFGTGGFSMGGAISGSADLGSGIQIGGGIGGAWAYGNAAAHNASFDHKVSYGGSYSWGDQSLSYYRTHYVNDETPQIAGTIGYRNGRYSGQVSNDVTWLLGNGDRWRTAAVQVELPIYGEQVITGFELYTGEYAMDGEDGALKKSGPNAGDYEGGTADDPEFRFGAAYVGIRRHGQVYRVGAEGEVIRHGIQNAVHWFLRKIKGPFTKGPVEYPANFTRLDNPLRPYGQIGTPKEFDLY